MIVIPPDQLPAETLACLLEEFVSRDGTDYGPDEVSLSSKVGQVRSQLARNEVLIVYDVAQEAANLVTRDQYQELLKQFPIME